MEDQQQTTLTYLDSYCERSSDPSLWGEPLNALSNLWFFAAAILAAYALGRSGAVRRTVDFWLLIFALAAIAVGSGLWHLVPRTDTMQMDSIPIEFFIAVYILSALRRFFKLSWPKAIGFWLLYAAVTVAVGVFVPPDTFNGTIMYVPTYATLAIFTLALWHNQKEMGKAFLTVLLVWTASLAFRTMDMQICSEFPLGTHFLWHTLNAFVLWRLLVLLMRTVK